MKTQHNDHADIEYCDLLRHILTNGKVKTDRTGTGTTSVFGTQMRFDLKKGFPLLTTKRIPFKLIVTELLWFLRGDTNIKYLVDNGNNIWTDWSYKAWLKDHNKPIPKGDDPTWEVGLKEFSNSVLNDYESVKKWCDLGPIYGYQWRKWRTEDGRTIDQISDMIEQIKKSPDSRRLIVSAWNPADIAEMAKVGLPPCHCLFQFWSANGKLSCHLYQRSCDTFLGVPFNIASYSLLLMMIAQVTGMQPDEFIWTGGDTHIYSNHMDQVQTQLSREPRPMPEVTLNPGVKNIFDFTLDDIKLENYNPHPSIAAPIAV